MIKKTADKIGKIIDVALIVISCFMIIDGVTFFVNTMGMVRSTEFQMLISLVHILAAIMIWMSVLTFRQIIVGIITRKS